MAPTAAKGFGGVHKLPPVGPGGARPPSVLVHFVLKMNYLAMMGLKTFSRSVPQCNPFLFLPNHLTLFFPITHTAPLTAAREYSIPWPPIAVRDSEEAPMLPKRVKVKPSRQAFLVHFNLKM